MNKIEKVAAKDAYDWAMAGILDRNIAWKTERVTGYGEAFNDALNKINVDDEAYILGKQCKAFEKAANKVPKPSSGKLKWILGGIIVLTIANQTGLDDIVITKVQQSYRRFQLWWSLPADNEGKHEA